MFRRNSQEIDILAFSLFEAQTTPTRVVMSERKRMFGIKSSRKGKKEIFKMASKNFFSTYTLQRREFSSSKDKSLFRHRLPLFHPYRRRNPSRLNPLAIQFRRAIDLILIYPHRRRADHPGKMVEGKKMILIYFNSERMRACGNRILT